MNILYDSAALPKDMRPSEKIRKFGPETLSDGELIAVVLGSAKVPGITVTDIWGSSAQKLQKLHLNSTAIRKILAVQELAKRFWDRDIDSSNQSITSPFMAASLMLQRMGGLDHEEIRLVCLNTKKHVIGEKLMAKGSDDSACISTRCVMRDVVQSGAHSFILYHNHPSGDPTPSPDDIAYTHNLKEAAKILGIPCVDHIIIGDGRYYSFLENNT